MSIWVMFLGEGLRSKDYEEITKATDWPVDLMGREDEILDELDTNDVEVRECIRRLAIEDLNISCYGSFNDEDERLFALHEWDPEGTGWLWKAQKVRRAPLDVAAAADRLEAAVERGDPDAEFMLEAARRIERWRESLRAISSSHVPETAAEIDSHARTTIIFMCRQIAGLCREMAARGVTNVMVAAEPM